MPSPVALRASTPPRSVLACAFTEKSLTLRWRPLQRMGVVSDIQGGTPGESCETAPNQVPLARRVRAI
jgi:hypothetical protein